MADHQRRLWEIEIEDENGDHVTRGGFTGTWEKAADWANEQADLWELESGGLYLKLTVMSLGKID